MSNTKGRAVVIGSGFGGAVAACRLSQAGYEVIILERGRRYTASDFPPLPDANSLLPDFSRWLWNGDRGLWDIDDLGEVVSVQSAGYGGGSLIYANVHLRPPKHVFDDRWPQCYRDGTELEPYYDLAGFMLDAAPLESSSPKVDRLEQFADQEKLKFFRPPLTITQRSKKPHLGIKRPVCKLCARCSTGCPWGAKNTLDWNYLAVAERHGARALTQCEVRDLRQRDGQWDIEYFDHLLQASAILTAPYVFLCAGAVNSTRLLAKLKTRDSKSAQIDHVGLGYHPNADAIAMVYDTNQELDPSQGPTIGGSLVHWSKSEDHADDSAQPMKDFFLVQDGGYSQELDRLLGMFRASVWLNRNRYSHVKQERGTPANTNGVARPAPSASESLSRAESLVSPLDAAKLVLLAAWSGHLRGSTLARLKDYFGPFITGLVEGTVNAAVGKEQSWRRALAERLVGNPQRLTNTAFDLIVQSAEKFAHHGFHRALGYVAGASKRRWMLLTMGLDATPGVLHYDAEFDRMVADLDLLHLLPMYQRQESLLAKLAASVGGEMRVNPAWSFLGKPYTVHGQGGCRMSDDGTEGPTDSDGAVRGVNGLYVLDGSLLCSSVGVNPSATITAIAERNVLKFIQKHAPDWPHKAAHEAGAREYLEHQRGAARWRRDATSSGWQLRPPYAPSSPLDERKLGITFKEALRGQIHAPSPDAAHAAARAARDLWEIKDDDDAAEARKLFRTLELNDEATFIDLDLQVSVPNLARFIEDWTHEAEITGVIRTALPSHTQATCNITWGRMQVFVPRYKPFALRDDRERAAQTRATKRKYLSVLKPVPQNQNAAPGLERTQLMAYELWFHHPEDPALWVLTGVKRLRQDPGLDLWEDTTSLFVTLRGPCEKRVPIDEAPLRSAGLVRIGPLGFFENQRDITVTGDDLDGWRKAWAIATFNGFFYNSLHQIYAPRTQELANSLFGVRGRSAHAP